MTVGPLLFLGDPNGSVSRLSKSVSHPRKTVTPPHFWPSGNVLHTFVFLLPVHGVTGGARLRTVRTCEPLLALHGYGRFAANSAPDNEPARRDPRRGCQPPWVPSSGRRAQQARRMAVHRVQASRGVRGVRIVRGPPAAENRGGLGWAVVEATPRFHHRRRRRLSTGWAPHLPAKSLPEESTGFRGW